MGISKKPVYVWDGEELKLNLNLNEIRYLFNTPHITKRKTQKFGIILFDYFAGFEKIKSNEGKKLKYFTTEIGINNSKEIDEHKNLY